MLLLRELICTEIYEEVCAISMQRFRNKALKEAFCSDDFDMDSGFYSREFFI